jgi:hypothetical protein
MFKNRGGVMALNRVQIQIFPKLCSTHNQELEEYLLAYSEEYIGRSVDSLDALTEEEADVWITKAYLKSLG